MSKRTGAQRTAMLNHYFMHRILRLVVRNFYLAVRFMNQFGVFSTAAEPIVWNPNRS
jgi:hypothetical protein